MKNLSNPSHLGVSPIRAIGSLCALALITSISPSAQAASGSWTLNGNGTWGNSGNWFGGDVANGVDATAYFTADLTSASSVTLDTSRTVGHLVFADPGSSFGTSVVGDGTTTLTLQSAVGAPTVYVDASETATLGSATTAQTIFLAGTQGFEKTGAGRLVIGANINAVANNTLAGNIAVTDGSLNIQGALNNVTVSLGNGTTLVVGSNGGATSQFKGLNSNAGNGTVAGPTGSSRTLVLVGEGDYSYGGVFAGGATTTSVSVNATLAGGGSQTFTNDANYNATTTSSGALISTTGSASGTPFGVGNMTLGVGSIGSSELRLTPSVASGAVSYTGANAVVGTSVTYGNGGHLVLDKGSASSLTYTLGNAGAAANSVLVRSTSGTSSNANNNGSLIITAGSGLANLGTANGEKLVINGGVALTNTIVNTSIIGRNGDATGSGSFLTYDNTDGFKVATYSASTNINGGTAFADTRVFDATTTSNNVLTADSSVYALRVSGTVSGAFALSVGANSANAPAAVILNGGVINTGTLAFGDSASGLIYTSAAGGTINSVITNITAGNNGRGITFEGPGVLTLGGINTFRGGAFINDTTVSISNNSNLGLAIGATGPGQVTLKGGTLRTTASLTLTNRPITLLAGVTDGGGIFDVQTGTTAFNSGSSGKIINGAGSLTKTGTGTLLLAGTVDNTYSGGTIVKAGTLSVQRSGLLGTGAVSLQGTGAGAANMGTLLVSGSTTLSNAITLSGGEVQRAVNAGEAYTLGTTGAIRSSFAGGVDTGVALLQSQTATAATTITYGFSKDAPVGVLNDGVRISDVFSLENMESGKMFTLQLSLDDINSGDYLGWYDTSTNTWTNAVLGNSNSGTMGLSGFQGDGAYNAGTDFVLGYWGYDSASNTVWAVVDHNSEFIVATVPEPGTTLLIGLGLGGVLLARRRRRASV
jgi:fibronectin-binding autotransporter adhesin